jgi:hypothetical protein
MNIYTILCAKHDKLLVLWPFFQSRLQNQSGFRAGSASQKIQTSQNEESFPRVTGRPDVKSRKCKFLGKFDCFFSGLVLY